MASEQPSVITFIWNNSSGTGDFQPTVFRPRSKILANFIDGGLTPAGANGIVNDLAEIMITHLRISLQKLQGC
jgi:hypothetical protein